MQEVPANMTVHLGPGVFETRGEAAGLATPPDPGPQNPGWRPRSGQRILGSGMGVTTRKIVGATETNHHYDAIGTTDDYLDGFEVCDLTVDCNVEGQPSQQVACGAIALRGGCRHVRIRRVRAIHFGSKAPGTVENGYYVENFVFYVAATPPPAVETHGDTYDCVYEDCVAETPGPNNVHNSTIFHFGGAETPQDLENPPEYPSPFGGRVSYHRGCVIRRCYVNADYAQGVPSLPVAVQSITPVQGQNRQFTLTTRTRHFREGRENVVLSFVYLGHTVLDLTLNNIFNGSHRIDDVLSEIELRFTLREPPPFPPEGFLDWDPAQTWVVVCSPAALGVPYNALSADNGTATVVEENSIYNCSTGGPYHDTGSTKDLTIRDNYYHNVYVGPVQNMGLISRGVGRDTAETVLAEKLKAGRKVLSAVLAPDDPRWLDFASEVPGDPNRPEPVDDVAWEAGLPGRIVVRWTPSPRAESYDVEVLAAAHDAQWTDVATVHDPVVELSLTPGAKVQVRVTARNAAGASVPSEPVPATVPVAAAA
jgi:hypothetical protein